MTSLDAFFSPYTDVALFTLRLFVGIIFIAHGWPKMQPGGQMGGMPGWGKILGQMGIPLAGVFGYVHPLTEVVGGILMILGLLTRVWAIGFAIIMLVVIFRVKMARGVPFWPRGQGQGTGWEYDFIILGVSLALLILGSGRLGLDQVLGLPL